MRQDDLQDGIVTFFFPHRPLRLLGCCLRPTLTSNRSTSTSRTTMTILWGERCDQVTCVQSSIINHQLCFSPLRYETPAYACLSCLSDGEAGLGSSAYACTKIQSVNQSNCTVQPKAETELKPVIRLRYTYDMPTLGENVRCCRRRVRRRSDSVGGGVAPSQAADGIHHSPRRRRGDASLVAAVSCLVHTLLHDHIKSYQSTNNKD